jgi:hypothetical protein
MPRLTTLHADFNDFVEDSRLAVLLRPVLGHTLPQVGQEVELRDSDGNSCQGRIESIDDGVAYVLVDWDTWVPSTPNDRQELSDGIADNLVTVNPSPWHQRVSTATRPSGRTRERQEPAAFGLHLWRPAAS